jgi:hypothetical protein
MEIPIYRVQDLCFNSKYWVSSYVQILLYLPVSSSAAFGSLFAILYNVSHIPSCAHPPSNLLNVCTDFRTTFLLMQHHIQLCANVIRNTLLLMLHHIQLCANVIRNTFLLMLHHIQLCANVIRKHIPVNATSHSVMSKHYQETHSC